MNRMKKAMYITLGCVGLALGAVGSVVPLLPSFPFLLLAAFCFARSSKKLDDWFKSTKLYRRVLEGYVTRRAMTVRAKLTLLIPVSVVLLASFLLMKSVPVGRAVVAVVWVAHVIYFGFVVKTEKKEG